MSDASLILGTIAAGGFGLYIYRIMSNVIKNNAEYKRMDELTGIYTDMLDSCRSIIDTIDVEIKYKDYMSKYMKYDGKPQENGYEQFMDKFEKHLFKTKIRLKK